MSEKIKIANGWLRDKSIYLGVYTLRGFAPCVCTTCKEIIEVNDAAYNPVLGLPAHKKCLEVSSGIR